MCIRDRVISGGGGSGPIILGQGNLMITNEHIRSATPPQPTVAVIVWDTNKPATSQVIYGLTSSGPYTLNLTLSNFGYPFGTVEDTNKVKSHLVQISGLVPGQVYSYRVVSKASPATVSNEYTFVLREDGTIQTNPVFEIIDQTDEQNNRTAQEGEVLGASTFRAGGINNEQEVAVLTNDEGIVLGTSDTTNNSDQTASAFSGSGFLSWNNILLAFLAVILGLIFFLWRNRKSQE